MKNVYDTIDPKGYENRYSLNHMEQYLHSHWSPVILELISKYCNNNIVLDLGCGTGLFTKTIVGKSRNIVALDTSRNMLRYGREHTNIYNFVLGNCQSLPIKANSIDVVVCIGLFEYVDREATLSEINRVMREKAIIILQCPNKYSAARMPIKLYGMLTKKDYIPKEPTYSELKDLLEKHRMEIIDEKMDDGLIFLPKCIDASLAKMIFSVIESIFKIFGRNPLSNIILFTARKKSSNNQNYPKLARRTSIEFF